MIVPLLLAGIRGGLAAASLGVELYDGAKRLWRGKGPLPGAQGERQPLTFQDVERQRAQMRAATSKGTVQGPAPNGYEERTQAGWLIKRPGDAPDTVRSFPPKKA